MSSIVGHVLVGTSVIYNFQGFPTKHKFTILVLLTIFLSSLPDLDILIYILISPVDMAPHRGITHTTAFAIILGASMAFLTYRYFRISYLKASAIFVGVLFLHILLDYLMGCGPPIKYFWPMSNKGYLFPLKMVPTAFYSFSFRGLVISFFSFLTLLGILLEITIFGPILLLLYKRHDTSRSLLMFVSFLGLILSIGVYNIW